MKGNFKKACKESLEAIVFIAVEQTRSDTISKTFFNTKWNLKGAFKKN